MKLCLCSDLMSGAARLIPDKPQPHLRRVASEVPGNGLALLQGILVAALSGAIEGGFLGDSLIGLASTAPNSGFNPPHPLTMVQGQ